MIVKKNKNLILLAGCIAVSAFALSGCRSGNFPKPNLSVLKFWKNPDAVAATTKVPPPPARYFDPAPILEEQVAKAKAGADETIDLNGQRFNEQFNQSLAQNANALSNGVDSNVRSLNQLIPKTPLKTDGSFSNAKEEFKAAMQNKVAAADTLKNAAKAPEKWQDFKLPADLKTKNVKPNLNQSLAGLNKSMYDANGKLVNNTQQVKDSVLKKLDQTKGAIAAKTTAPENSLNDFMAATKEKAAQLSPLKSNQFDFKAQSVPNSMPIINQFVTPSAPKTTKPPSFMANLQTQAPASTASDAQLKLVQAQVADANRQIELLKQQIAQSVKQPPARAQIATQTKAAAPIQTPIQAPAAPVARTSQLQTPRFGTSSYSAANYPKQVKSLSSVSPKNILRATESLRSNPAEPVSTEVAPAFPSTPHGNFAPQGNFGSTSAPAVINHPSLNAAAPHSVAPVNFQTNDFQTSSNSWPALQGSTASSPTRTADVQKIKSHISQVDIPASILSGSGSYAPGSVHQVQR